MITPLPVSRPTYWIYHELWRLLSRPSRAGERLRDDPARARTRSSTGPTRCRSCCCTTCRSRALLLRNLVRGRDWVRIDFNIGKLVEPAGD